MHHNKVLNPQFLELYHGTLELIGDKIDMRSGKGVGWNALTLGNAFYTSECAGAACLFSHLVLQKSILAGGERFDNLGFAKVYKISLNRDASILDADQALDASSVRRILLRAGVSEGYLKFRHDDQLTDFKKAADLLCYGMDWEGNRNEYLTKELGYEGLLIKENAWENWDYYPSDIGIDWDKLTASGHWRPKTVAIYDTKIVSGFILHRDGIIYEQQSGFSELSR